MNSCPSMGQLIALMPSQMAPQVLYLGALEDV